MYERRLKILQQMPVFGGLSEDSLAFLLNLAPIVSIPTGDFFFHEMQRGGTMYVLEKGKVAVFKPFECMGHLLAYLGTGDCFGEMELIDLHPRVASVMAITDSTAIQISSACLLSLYKKDLEQFTLIQMNMSREISRRLRRLDEEFFKHKQDSSSNGMFFLTRQEIIEQGLDITQPE
jgi:CRP-like cAMP-binding protein